MKFAKPKAWMCQGHQQGTYTQNRRYSTFFVDKTAIVRANISLSSSGPSITVTFPRCFKAAWASCLFLFSRKINDRMKSSACPTDVWRPLDQTSITRVNSGLALGVVPACFKQSGHLSPFSSSRPISNSRDYLSVSPLYGPFLENMPSCSTVTEITNLPAFETMKSLSNSFVISQGHQSVGGLIFYLNLNLSKTAHIRDTRYLLPIIYEPDNEAFYISYWPIMKL